jgi:glutaredoxin-related protein
MSISEVSSLPALRLLIAQFFFCSFLEDADVLIPLLHRLTSSTELPVLLIGGKPVGSIAAIRELNGSGELATMITNAGSVIDGTKKKKGH